MFAASVKASLNSLAVAEDPTFVWMEKLHLMLPLSKLSISMKRKPGISSNMLLNNTFKSLARSLNGFKEEFVNSEVNSMFSIVRVASHVSKASAGFREVES